MDLFSKHESKTVRKDRMIPPAPRVKSFLCALLLAWFSAYSTGLAAPSGAAVVSGSVTITNPNSATTNITQSTDKAIINWQKFGINSNELVQFFQPGFSSIALNRVIGTDPSVILGALKSNGQVWLLNPGGILFGAGAQVNVGGLLASTLTLNDQNFLNGNYTFVQDPAKPLSFVENQGYIQALNSGSVVLLAPLVDNEGTIVANLGQVKLGAATSAVLNFDGQGYLNYVLQGNPTPKDVVMTKEALTNLVSGVVNNGNLVSAGQVIDNGDGTVSLRAGEGTAINGGTIAVNGAPGAKAGSVEINSTQVSVLSNQSSIQANGAGANSNGGHVKVYSQGNTLFAGTIQAKGGVSGNGGFVETSGEKNLYSFGNVNTSAPNGTMGMWLLDPASITITDASSGGSADGSLPTIGTGTTGTVDAGTLASQTSNISITATNDIIINDMSAAPESGNIALSNNVSLTLTSNSGNITFNRTADTITASGTGSISMTANSGTITAGNLTSGSSCASTNCITLSDSGNMTSGTLSAGGNGISLTASGGNIGTSSSFLTVATTGALSITDSSANKGVYVKDTSTPSSVTLSVNKNNTTTADEVDIGGTTNKITYSTAATPVLGSSGTFGAGLTFTDSAGSFAVGTITGSNSAVSLTATAGDISDSSSNISAGTGSVTLKAGGSTGIGTLASPINVNTTGAISVTTTGSVANLYVKDTNTTSPSSVSMTMVGAGNANSFVYTNNVTSTYLEYSSAGVASAAGTPNSNITLTDTETLYSASNAMQVGSVVVASGNSVTLTSNNNDITDSTSNISAGTGSITLSSGGQVGIGTLANPIKVNTTGALSATMSFTGTSMFVKDTNTTSPSSVTMSMNGAPTANSFMYTNNVTTTYMEYSTTAVLSSAGTPSSNLTFTDTSTGNVSVGTVSPASGQSVSVTSSGGSILDSTSSINTGTGSITLSAANGIGASGAPINVNTTGAISATTTTTGSNLFVKDTNNTSPSSISMSMFSGGAANSFIYTNNGTSTYLEYSSTDVVSTAGTPSSNITLTDTETLYAAGNAMLVGSVVVASGKSVTLTSNNNDITDSTSNISNGSGSVTLSAGGSGGIGTSSTLISIASTGALSLTTTAANAGIYAKDSSTPSSVTVSVNKNNTTSADTIDIGGTTNKITYSTAATPVLASSGTFGTALTFTDTAGSFAVGTLNASSNAVSLTSSTGSITDSTSSITAGALTLSAGTAIGASGTPLSGTITGTLTATASNGLINYTNSGSLAIGSITSSAGNGAVTLAATGASGNMTSASSSISTGSGSVSLTAAGTTGIGTSASLIGVASTGSLTVSETAANAGVYVKDSSTPSSVTLSVNGNNTTNADEVDIGGTTNKITYSTAATPVLSTSGTFGTPLTFTDTGGSFAVGTLNASTSTVSLTSSTGNITSSSSNITAGNLTLTASSGTLGTSGTALSGSITGKLTATAGGVINFTNAGSYTVGTVNAGSNAVTLAATSGGSITDSSSAITAGNLTLTAGGAVGSSGTPLSGTITGTLTATASNGLINYTNSGSLAIGSITSSAGNGAVTLAATGASGNMTSSSSSISSGSGNVSLTAAGTTGIGTSASLISVASTGGLTVSETAANAGVYVKDSSTPSSVTLSVNKNNTSNADEADIGGTTNKITYSTAATPVLASSGTFGAGLTFTDTAGSFAVGTLNASSNAVSLTSSTGSITDSTSSITAGALTLSAGTAIGASGTPLSGTITGTLTATASSGLINYTNSGSLAIGSITSSAGNGAVTLAATGSSGNMTSSSSSISTGSGSVSLTAAGTTGIGTSASLISVASTGGLTVSETAANAGVYVKDSSTPSSVTVSVNKNNTSNADEVDIGGTTNKITYSTAATPVLASSGTFGAGLTFTDSAGSFAVGTLNASSNAVSLTSSTGSITDSTSSITAGALTLSAGTAIGASGTPLSGTITGTLTATASNGLINYTNSGSLAIGSITSSAGNGAVTLAATGASGNMTSASSSISSGSGNVSLTAAGTTGIGTSASLISVASTGGLTVSETAANAGVYVKDSSTPSSVTLSVNKNNTSNADEVDIGGTTNKITYSTAATPVLSTSGTFGAGLTFTDSAGSFAVGTLNASSNAVSLTSSTGSITDSTSSITAGALTLSAGTSIGASGTPLSGTITGTLTATASSGLINYSNTGALAVGTVTASGSGNNVTLASTGAMTDATSNITGGNLTLSGTALGTSGTALNGTITGKLTATATSGLINFSNTGGFTVGSISAGSNTVKLVSTGAMTDASSSITAGTLTLNGTSVGTSGAPIQGTASTLNGTSTSGGLFYTNASDLTLGTLTATGSITVKTSSGSLTLASGSANSTGGSVTLTAANSILDPAASLTANGNSTLTATSGVIGTSATPLNVNVTGGTLSVSAGGVQGGISVDINGTVSPSNTLTVSNSPSGKVYFNGTCLFGCGSSSSSSSSSSGSTSTTTSTAATAATGTSTSSSALTFNPTSVTYLSSVGNLTSTTVQLGCEDFGQYLENGGGPCKGTESSSSKSTVKKRKKTLVDSLH